MVGLRTSFQRTGLFAFTLCLTIVGFETSALADGPPETRAARLTVAQGTVTVNTPGYTESVPAQTNLPLLAGVQLVTGADGQAEIEFEDGSIARLTPNSALSLDNLSIEPNGVFTTSVRLMHGLAYFELRATAQYMYAIAAGADILTPVENTTVRVNFDEPPAIFAVLDGTAHVERQSAESVIAGYQADVRAGESFRGDANDGTRYFLNQGIAGDSWDQWNGDLDQQEASAAADSTSVRNDYEGAQGYGWSDLDANGTWYNVPGQGPVWQPQIAADDMGFDPYGDGEWIAYPGAGYLWASAYPWGWTPYRCGTWSFFGGFGWGWAPGVGCGGLGWGFYGGGQVVNIGIAPSGYRPIRVPIRPIGPHPIHPVLPVRAYHQGGEPSRPIQYGQRQIAGKTAVAITPARNTFNSGPNAGSSLHRDFPVDSKSHAPVLGLASTSPTAVHESQGSRRQQPVAHPTTAYPSSERPAVSPSGTPAYTGQPQPSNGQARPNNGQYRPDNGSLRPDPARSQPASPSTPKPTEQAAPGQRSTPAPSHPTYSPPPSPPPSHPTYTPPPSPPPSHPTYTPPPSPPASHPSYSPPPSPPPPPSPAPSPPPSAPSSPPHNSPK